MVAHLVRNTPMNGLTYILDASIEPHQTNDDLAFYLLRDLASVEPFLCLHNIQANTQTWLYRLTMGSALS